MNNFSISTNHAGLSSVEALYSNLQRIYIRSKKGEEKRAMLRLTVEIKTGLTISLGKALSLQITDDNDCTFFYSLLLTAEDFGLLKSQQGLLVDFDHFPAQLIKFLEICGSQEFNKFILVLDEEDNVSQGNINQKHSRDFAFLKIIETNDFKNLCHLSLKVLKGSDADIKNHMASKIANLTEKLFEEEKKRKLAEINLTETLKALDCKTKELTDSQLKLCEEKNNLIFETSQQLAEEKEKISKLQIEWQRKLEAEKSEQVKQFQKQLNELNDQINSLTFNNKNLYEAKCHFETLVKEKNFHMEALEKQIIQLKQELELLRKQNGQLDQDYHEKDKTCIGLKTKLAVFEQELKDKTKFLDKQQELLKIANEQKSFLEEALNEKESNLQRKQSAVQTLSTDLMKSNEIIARLKTDLLAIKAKMKLRTDIALEQEKILEKKTHQITNQSETINELEDKIQKLTEELNSKTTKLEKAIKEIEEKEMIIKKNDNVISWLNRRLTESNSFPNSVNNILSSRLENDSPLGTSQPKGSVSNLAKGWPPWLVNSVAGYTISSSLGHTAGNFDAISKLSSSSIPIEHTQDQPKSSLQKSENNICKDNENLKENKLNDIEPRVKGLDPKYFESCVDKDYVVNPQVLKVCSDKSDWKPKSSKSVSKPVSARQPPMSAYFPKKPVPL